jgi:hypothetical protein
LLWILVVDMPQTSLSYQPSLKLKA